MLFKVLMKNFRCQLKMCEGVQSFYKIVLRVQEEKVCRPLLYGACLARHSWPGDWTLFCGPAVFHSFSITLRSRIQKLGSRVSFRVPSPISFLGIGSHILRKRHTQKPSFCIFSPIIMFKAH